MKRALRAVVCGVLLGAAATVANAQFSETESNNRKSEANTVNCISASPALNNPLTGTTTGTSTTIGAGNASADFFRIKTCALSPAIYKHRLTLTTSGPAGHQGGIMGVLQGGSPSDATPCQLSTAASSPPRFNQWYGFGRGEELYYRVTGTSGTTATYSATLTTTVVTPVVLSPNFTNGSITIQTVGQTTVNTELFLYDSNYNLIRWNDDGSGTQSQIIQTLAPGTYYLAVSDFNTAIQQANGSASPNPPNNADFSNTGNRLDIADGIVRANNSAAAVDLDFQVIDSTGAYSFTVSMAASYEIYWAELHVIEPQRACCLTNGACQDLTVTACTTAGGLAQGTGSVCASTNCPAPQACCFNNGQCADLPPPHCTAASGASQGAATACASWQCPQPGACCLADGSCSVTLVTQCTQGVFQGEGTNCSPNPCPQPGACCLPDGNCLVTTQPLCGLYSGIFSGSGTVCPTTGVARVYSAAPLAPIPDFLPSGLASVINVPIHAGISDVDVVVNITHTFLGDLAIHIAHGSTQVTLWSTDCGGNDDMAVTFDDAGANVSCFSPTSGTFNPNSLTAGQLLSAFNGQNQDAFGDWTLTVIDAFADDTGFLASWQVIFTSWICAPSGSCCQQDGSCGEPLTQAACLAQGGLYQGDDVLCANVTCPQAGACCYTSGACQTQLQVTCEQAGGAFQGVATNCGAITYPAPVTWPTGFQDISQDVLAQSLTLGDNGVSGGLAIGFPFYYYGQLKPTLRVNANGFILFTADNGGYANNDAVLPAPATPNDAIYALWDDLDPSAGGTLHFRSLGTAPDRMAIVQWKNVPQHNTPGSANTFQIKLFEGSNCVEIHYQTVDIEPTLTDFTIGLENADGTLARQYDDALQPQDLSGLRLVFCPSGMNCPQPTGACCLADGSCVASRTRAQCQAICGTYHGDGTTCSPNSCPQPPIACCFADGSCLDQDALLCVQLSGSAQAVGTSCATFACPQPLQACCFITGLCSNLTAANCQSQSGIAEGIGTACATFNCPVPQMACCFASGACQILGVLSCANQGGTSQAQGSTCSPNPCPQPDGACCLPSGSCSITLQASCAGQFLGVGSTCSPNPCVAQCLRGDANCDGLVNNFDIDPFVQGLLNDPTGYANTGAPPPCFALRTCWGDINQSGSFNNFDIDAYVGCILTPPAPGHPCP